MANVMEHSASRREGFTRGGKRARSLSPGRRLSIMYLWGGGAASEEKGDREIKTRKRGRGGEGEKHVTILHSCLASLRGSASCVKKKTLLREDM